MNEIKLWVQVLLSLGFDLIEKSNIDSLNILTLTGEIRSADYCDQGFGDFQNEKFNIRLYYRDKNLIEVRIINSEFFMKSEDFEKRFKTTFRDVKLKSIMV